MDKLYDFHTHTFLSDGALSPIELIRRAAVAGYSGLALTDHVGRGGLARVIGEIRADCELAEAHWRLRAVPGIELTHVPPEAIADLAAEARSLGAQIVIVHGESPVEPVAPGTNARAAACPLVDVLAHPGLLTEEEAEAAAANGVFLEITARGGHNAANGLVVKRGRAAGARFLVNSDAHDPRDLLNPAWARTVAAGAGLTDGEITACLIESPQALLARIAGRAGDDRAC